MREKKIPTILGIVLVLFLVGALAVLTQGFDKAKSFLTRAEVGTPPSSQVETANITDSSFTVFWVTEKPSNGAVFYGKTPELEGGVAVDQRDLGGSVGNYTAHFVKVSNLTENTKYYFKVGQTQSSYGDPEKSNAPFEVSTGPQLTGENQAETLSGSALKADGSPLDDGVGSWQSPGSSKVASLINKDGTYELSVNLARTSDLSDWFEAKTNGPEKILIHSGEGQATLNCLIGQTTKLPSVKVGETIDCVEGNPESTGSSGSFGSLVKDGRSTNFGSAGEAEINIESGETVSTGLPTFSGKVAPKQVVKITIHSEEIYTGTVIADSNGSWSWAPPATLGPGEHTVTLTIVNADGTTQTVTRTFFVTAGQSILPVTAGTPSGTLSPTPTLTPTPAPTPADRLVDSGVVVPTFLALTTGFIFIILSIGAIFYGQY